MKSKPIITVLLVAHILASCSPVLAVVPTETVMPSSTFTPAPTATTATSIPLIPKDRFSNGYFEVAQPTQDLIEKGLETGVIKQEIDVNKLVFDVHDSKNHPNQKIVFGRNPKNHEIVLATRVNPNTGEMSWCVVGLRDLADVVGMTMGTQLYSPNNQLFSHSDVQRINALVIQEYNHAIIMEAGWAFTESQEGVFDFIRADEAVDLAMANGMTAEGDDLIYGPPDFDYAYLGKLETELRNQGTTDEEIKQRFETIVKNHITQVVTHFRGKLQEYSVLNEWRGKNTERPDKYSVIFNNDDEFVKMVFETARNADPNARLFYNDNDLNTRNSYGYPYALQKIRMLASSGLIDAVGIQMTDIVVANPPDQKEVIATMQSWNLPLIVTSATFESQNVNGTDLEVQQRQAEVAVQMLDACVKSGVCKDFRFWDGYSDKFSFHGADTRATIFDENMKPKLAYFAIKDYLTQMIDGKISP
ncbi:MAG: endo-1,4-beta-xylanase [Anaerolineales bacterium]